MLNLNMGWKLAGSKKSNLQTSRNAKQISNRFRSLKSETQKLLTSFFQPPIVPKVEHAGDSTNFETYPEEDWQSSQDLPETVLEKFNEF